jgi:hypothetical protein
MEKLLLIYPLTGRISITFNQQVLRSVGQLHYHNPTQHHKDFIAQRDFSYSALFFSKQQPLLILMFQLLVTIVIYSLMLK